MMVVEWLGWTAFLSTLDIIFIITITQILIPMDMPISPIGSISDVRIVILIRVVACALRLWPYPKRERRPRDVLHLNRWGPGDAAEILKDSDFIFFEKLDSVQVLFVSCRTDIEFIVWRIVLYLQLAASSMFPQIFSQTYFVIFIVHGKI